MLLLSIRIVLETDAQTVASRVSMRGAEGEMPITEQVGLGKGQFGDECASS